MLKGLLKSNEDKVREKLEQHISEGMRMLNEKFFNGAMVEFDKAMALSSEQAYPKLREEMERFAAANQLESALSIGMNLIKDRKTDFDLANKLGNYARELKNYTQAEGLYKLALKAKKNYELAFYNLAACTARVDKYDSAVKSSLSIFDDLSDYVLPDFIGGGDLIELMGAELDRQKGEKIDTRLQELRIEKEGKENAGQKIEAEDLQLEIEKLKDQPRHATEEDFLTEFNRLIQEAGDHAKDHYYNLALYAISINRLEIAEDALSHISRSDFDAVELMGNILKAKRGQIDAAIDGMIKLLGENEYNRYCNVNIGLMYKKGGKRFLAVKYLIKTAQLLEKSGGIYSMKELVKLAHSNYDQENYVKALNFYKIASTEIPDVLLWERMGNIYQQNKKYDDAIACFKRMVELEPGSEVAKIKIREMHDYYFQKAEKLVLENKFKPAADYIHKALGVARFIETLQMATKIYTQLKQPDKAEEYKNEYLKLVEQEKMIAHEKERLELLQTAKAYMAKKNYLKAIESYESALRMKVDKQVFLQLAAIYKGLKKHGDLQDLVRRYEKMVEHEEKLKRFEKEQERERQAAEDRKREEAERKENLV